MLLMGKHGKNSEGRLEISSNVTLVKSDKNIIVDTGGFRDRNALVAVLKGEGVEPGDIDVVVLTHMHLDHVVNVDLFVNADVYLKFSGHGYPGQVHHAKDGTLERTDIVDGAEIVEGVTFLLTPGHSEDMVSVVVDTSDGKVVVAGDAIPGGDWLDESKEPDPMIVFSVEKFNESRKKILNVADYVVPGHGEMVEV